MICLTGLGSYVFHRFVSKFVVVALLWFKLQAIQRVDVMKTEHFSIVELDQVLAQDTEGSEVQTLQKTLVDAAEHCRSRLDHGVSPEEAKRLNAMMAACSSGLGLLPALWQTQQERN